MIFDLIFFSDSEGIYTWNREIFLERERPSIRPYLETLIGKDGVQYFERFVQERLEALKNGIAVNDWFEKEVQSLDVRGLSKGIWVWNFFEISGFFELFLTFWNFLKIF
ncbi:hypothetical protein ACQ4LE_005295 [Meloidogyne hapla]